MEENKTIITVAEEVKTINERPRIDDSVRQKKCWKCDRATLKIRLHTINDEIGTVNIYQPCELEAEMEVVKEKYNGDTKEMLKQNAIAAGQGVKKAFGKLLNFGKSLLAD